MFSKLVLMAPLVFFVQALNRGNRPPPIRIPPPGAFFPPPEQNPWIVEQNPFAAPYHFPRPPLTTRTWWGRAR
ncbi:unnamed protein product [Cylicocyclus nassatus]|uniref:Uncharacterized protein n=1 Tax=Cylicocyclus nassatus TaxID=53992 RepID=A0AA36GWP4_CYLNA|nr:unnamed protein product [Cylicocyclus nassatus]